MAVKKKVMYKQQCRFCDCVLNFASGTPQTEIQKRFIKHAEISHRDQKANVYDAYGSTGDEQYDLLLKGLHNYKVEIDKLAALLNQERQDRQILVTKLNGIILILQNKA